MSLDSLKTNKAFKEIITEIVDMIENGGLLPGENLPKPEVFAKETKLPLQDINETLRILAGENIIHKTVGGDYTLAFTDRDLLLDQIKSNILNINSESIIDLLEIREGLEIQAIILATERATSDDLINIEKALNKLIAAVKNNKIATEEDLEFHLAIAKASHNHLLYEIIHTVFKRFSKSLYETRAQVRKLDRVDYFLNEHQEMYDLIRTKKPHAAKEAMRTHINNTINLYRDIRK